MRPNLFDFATNELSQDAMFCWLLAWADHRCARFDPALHAAGRAFVGGLFTGASSAPVGPYAVDVRRQQDRCDIVAEIGDQHVLAIEDKTGTGAHGDQLARYRRAVEDRYPTRTRALAFVKTEEQCNLNHVENDGWTVIRRGHLLELLRPHAAEANSDILRDYVERLERIEADVRSYLTMPPEQWSPRGRLWHGLFEALMQRGFNGAGWGPVENPTGGFEGFSWGWYTIDPLGSELYVQLEEHKLVLKVAAEDRADAQALGQQWSTRCTGEHGGLRFSRPARLRRGSWMTVAVFDGDYRVRDSGGLLDLEATVALLRRVDAVAQQVAVSGNP